MKRFILTIVCLVLFSLTSVTFAHRGRTDAYGGHNERATGTYHFHSGPLAGQSFSSKSEAIQLLGNMQTPEKTTEQQIDNREMTLVGSAKSNKYHIPSCRSAQRINPNNLVTFSSPKDAQSKGYVPCKICKP